MSLTVNTVLWHCEYIITQHNLKGGWVGGGGGSMAVYWFIQVCMSCTKKKQFVHQSSTIYTVNIEV